METKKKPAARENKRSVRVLDGVVITATVVLVAFGIWSTFKNGGVRTCAKPGNQHEVTLKDDAFSTSRLELTQCDTIQVVNMGKETYELVFGTYDKHINYPGYKTQTLRPNEFFVIDATQAGTYPFHDHLRDNARIEFNIREKVGS